MKHKPYKDWILDEPILSLTQEKDLQAHLTRCADCWRLSKNWESSKLLLLRAAPKAPSPGFTIRWQNTLTRKSRMEKARQFRLTLLGLLMLALMGSLSYTIASGVLVHMLSLSFSGFLQLVIAIANGLSNFGKIVQSVPVYVYLTIGFILFGLFNAFLLVGVFTLWNLKYRKLLPNETPTN